VIARIDVHVMKVRNDFRLEREAALPVGVQRAQDLDRHHRAHQPVARPPHDRVAALAERLQQDEAVVEYGLAPVRPVRSDRIRLRPHLQRLHG
jgi:7-keto-8-aminopelargonate synthetase-like enzyme